MTKPSLAEIPFLPVLLLVALLGGALVACDATPPSDSASPPPPSASAEEDGPVSPAGEELVEVLAEPDPYARVARLAALLPELGPEALPQAKRAVQRAGLDGAENELLVRYWATLEPQEATEWALYRAAPRYKLSALATAVELWARADPAAAVEGVTWAAQGGIRDVAQTVQMALVQGWFARDREALEQYIQGLGTGRQRQRSIFGYAVALARTDGPDAAMRWAESIPDEDRRYKSMVFRQTSVALAWVDPEAAQRWCDRHCEGPYGGGLRGVLARVQLRLGEDGGQLMEWLSEAPESEETDTALKATFDAWALQEREKALAWMDAKLGPDREPDEPWVRKLYGAYARHLAAVSPEEGIAWAKRVENEKTRHEILVRIAREWMHRDPEAAQAWLAESPLSEEERARARNLKIPTYLPEAPKESGEAEEPETAAP